ncbi:hypothetical protein KZZ52_19695 [Dactylosporangium sp. AC04546]|uniref:hypothetical protein n=1 Tax=Dactylosporangium sp. AC04546 TaxID=2862460 RepID=UPI001EDE04BC|nr:hypothetical protein [Dactylosporangium sp. AC04546]WVK87525.1 hypothetical protein KZZ52_19695 [Dactylosporangium sp. AC04546]
MPTTSLPTLLSAVGSTFPPAAASRDESEMSDSLEALARRVVEILTAARSCIRTSGGDWNRDTIAHRCVSAGVGYDAHWRSIVDIRC